MTVFVNLIELIGFGIFLLIFTPLILGLLVSSARHRWKTRHEVRCPCCRSHYSQCDYCRVQQSKRAPQ